MKKINKNLKFNKPNFYNINKVSIFLYLFFGCLAMLVVLKFNRITILYFIKEIYNIYILPYYFIISVSSVLLMIFINLLALFTFRIAERYPKFYIPKILPKFLITFLKNIKSIARSPLSVGAFRDLHWRIIKFLSAMLIIYIIIESYII